MPKKITVRFILSERAYLIIEHDDKRAAIEFLEIGNDDWSHIIKGIEITLATLGYKLDEQKMYMDTDLIVANFYRET